VRAERAVPDADIETQRKVVDAFLAAARDGDFDRLVALLDPDVAARIDFGPVRGSRETRGAAAVARQALGYARLGLDMRPALINGVPGGVASATGSRSRSAPSRSGTARSSSSTSSTIRSGSASST
jgi:ketosteroid isomerase-like protein